LQRSCDDERGAPFCIGRLILVRDAITRGTANEILNDSLRSRQHWLLRDRAAFAANDERKQFELFHDASKRLTERSYLALKTNLCNYLVWDPYWVAGLAFTVGGLVGASLVCGLAHYRRHLNRRRKSDPTLADLRALRQDIAIVAAH
jgi:hypothetical protein